MSTMQQLNGINIAIASGSKAVRQLLQTNLQQRGASISYCGSLSLSFVIRLEHEAVADIVLVDINDNNGYHYDEAILDLLLERVDIPVLFHDYDCSIDRHNNDPVRLSEGTRLSEHQLEQLAEKISAQVTIQIDRSLPAEGSISAEGSLPAEGSLLAEGSLTPDTLKYDSESAVDINVWVLGASIGGPESVKRFLTTLPADLPVAFVLAQHLGEGFEKLLAQQLSSVSRFRVRKAENGDFLKHGEVLVVPVNKRITFNHQGMVSVLDEQWKGHYKPSINEVISDVTLNFSQHLGVIILSGMGADGVESSEHLHKQYQGIVWAQEAGSCIVSSMPDSARKADIVSYSGSPEAMANKIVAHYSD